MTAATSRNTFRYLNRASVISSASDNTEKISRRASGVGPVLKKGGGVCSITQPSVSLIGDHAQRRAALFVIREYRIELLFQRPARAARDARQRIFGDDHRQAGLLHQQTIHVAQQRATTGQHHSALRDVGREFWRCLFECGFYSADNAV